MLGIMETMPSVLNGSFVSHLSEDASAYTRQVAQRLEEPGYRLRFHGILANRAEVSIVAHLVRGASVSLFNEGNMGLVRERGNSTETLPMLVALVARCSAFDNAQRQVRTQVSPKQASVLWDLHSDFHRSFRLLAQVILMELSVLAGEERAEEWNYIKSHHALRALAETQPRFVRGLNADNAFERLVARMGELTTAFLRAQTRLGCIAVLLTEMRSR
jgi:hypothetical protein